MGADEQAVIRPGGDGGGRLPPDERPERGVRYFVQAQTPVSAAAAVLGVASLLVLVIGSIVVFSSRGWVPFEAVAASIQSRVQTGVVFTSIALAAVALVIGLATFRRMATKPSREAAVAGAVLGAQTLILAALFLWFRSGAVDIFARNFLNFGVLAEFWERFVRGAVNTVILALSGEAIGIALGLLLAVFTLSRRAVVRAPARVYINFFRGTPLLWQLSFFGLGVAFSLRLPLTVYQVAILVLGLNAGAYSAEIFRAGIQSIERGQYEAARSLGMSYFQALRHVILPQGFRRVIPPLTNEFVILIKDTSLVSILGLTFNQQELMAVGRDLYSDTFNATAFVGSAAGYLVVTLPMIRVVTWVESKLRSGLVGIT